MLSTILSISGRPGLYRLVSTNKNMNLVESLKDGKKLPIYMHEKVVALSDVSIYTTTDDVPLAEVFEAIKEKANGEKVNLGSKSSKKDVFDYLAQVLPDYDKDRVYPSDAKKIFAWYNILIENNIDFKAEEKPAEEANEQEEA